MPAYNSIASNNFFTNEGEIKYFRQRKIRFHSQQMCTTWERKWSQMKTQELKKKSRVMGKISRSIDVRTIIISSVDFKYM